jgi:hypothetical protein
MIDAINFDLVDGDSSRNEKTFRDSVLRLLTRLIAILFYIIYLVPLFSFYIVINYSGVVFQRTLKFVSGMIYNITTLFDEDSSNQEKPIAYNP